MSVYASLPNLITLARLGLVPVVIAMISAGHWREACVLFIVAGISDGVDGWLAKKFSLRTELGAYLDPLADKALLVSIYVTLAVAGTLPSALAIVVVARDVMIIGAFMISWFMDKRIKIRPLLISKVNTVAQIAFAAAVLGAKAFHFAFPPAFDFAAYAVAALTLASLAAYLASWSRHMSL